MVTSTSVSLEPEGKIPPKVRKPGRPQAIPTELEPMAVETYRQGNGYRAISRILGDEYRVSADFSTVKRVLKRLGELDKDS